MTQPDRAAFGAFDHCDVVARAVGERFPEHDTIDVAITLRLYRVAQLLARRSRVDLAVDIAEIGRCVDAEALQTASRAARFLGDLDRQDLVELLRRLTVGLGDLPGAEAVDA